MDEMAKPVTLLTQEALEGSVIAILLLLSIVTIVAVIWATFWFRDKRKFIRAKKASGVPMHVVQTESTAQLARAVHALSSTLGRIEKILDKQMLSIADLATATNGLNHLQEAWGAQVIERDDKAHDGRQAIRMTQRDMSDKLNEIHRRIGKLDCSARDNGG